MAEKKQRKEKKEIAKVEEKKEEKYPIRGNIFEGKIISAKANKTVTVERMLSHYIPKYERYKKVRSKIKAHNPKSINAKENDWVRVGETRRISKTKSFVVMEVMDKKKD